MLVCENAIMISEVQARSWLTSVASGKPRIESNKDYLFLREAMGVTAGFNRGPNFEHANFSSEITLSVLSALELTGIYALGDVMEGCSWSIIKSIADLEEDFLASAKDSRTIPAPSWAYYLIKRALTSEVLQACKIYLGTDFPYLYTPVILASSHEQKLSTMTSEEKSDRAFAFHRDIDNVRWLKLFISLTHCEGGEHHYCIGSHYTFDRSVRSDYLNRVSSVSSFKLPFDAKTPYETHIYTGRFSDQSIEELFRSDSLHTIHPLKGHAWLEDTYGLHKGGPPTVGTRLVLSTLIGLLDIRYK